MSGTAKRSRERAVGEPICAANWGNRRSLKAGAHPCQNATTHREKRLRGAGFDAPSRALHGTEIIGFAQRAKRGGLSPPLRRQRSEERRVGKECFSTCRFRRSQYNTKKKKK